MIQAVVLSVAVLLFVCSQGLAQSSPPEHQHSPANVIDGALHPEQIPDLSAYRLYFLMLAEPINPTDEQRKRQDARIARIGLSDADRQVLITILAGFKADYQNTVRSFNEAATSAWKKGERTDVKPLLLRRDQLVQAIHDQLKSQLSPQGVALLEAHIQSQKKFMKVSVEEARK